jgi:hypothetical protein
MGRLWKCAHIVLVGQKEGTIRKPYICRWEDNSKMDLKEIRWVGIDWVQLTQDRD